MNILKKYFFFTYSLFSLLLDCFLDRVYLIFNYKKGKNGLFSLKKYKTSDTLFVFGTGSTLLDLTEEQLQEVRKNDSFGINFFTLFDFIPTYYSIEYSKSTFKKNHNKKIFQCLDERSDDYKNVPILLRDLTIFDMLNGKYKKLLPTKLVDNFYYIRRMNIRGSNKKTFNFTLKIVSLFRINYLASSLLSKRASIICAISFAHKLGYKKIVLLGVDLNNTDYFYFSSSYYRKKYMLLPEQLQTGNVHATFDSKLSFATVPYVLSTLSRSVLQDGNVQIFVGSKKSALYPKTKLWKWKTDKK